MTKDGIAKAKPKEKQKKRGLMTVDGIAAAKPKKIDRWLTDNIIERKAGRLTLRISPKGVKRFYFRYAKDGERVLIPLGVFTRDATPSLMTLEEARAEARRLSALHRAEESRDVREHLAGLARKRAEAEAAEVARIESERAAAEARRVYSLRALAAAYVDGMERRGKKRSAADARNIFKNHLDGKPVADKTANEVQRAEITAVLRALVEAGKGRTAGKLRSYLRAAYSTAMRAEGDANAPAGMIAFQVEANPVADTAALAEFTKARNRTLTEPELWCYWQRLAAVESEQVQAALQLALLLGGQRIAQLMRLKRTEVDLSAGFLTLHDPKGKRKQPRVHELPITPVCTAILRPLMARAEALDSEFVFSTDGTKPISPETLTGEVHRISAAMKSAKETRAPFMLSDLRRTVETMLASMGVSQDIRAQVQSHGLGGVQARHYDRHDYRLEKLDTLTAWANRVTTEPKKATVDSLPRKRAAARRPAA